MIFVDNGAVQSYGKRLKLLEFSLVHEILLLHEEAYERVTAHRNELLPYTHRNRASLVSEDENNPAAQQPSCKKE